MLKFSFLAYRSAADLNAIPEKAFVVGIEVPTTAAPEILSRCNVIIDPQHTDGKLHCAAMEVSLGLRTPGYNTAVDLYLDAVLRMNDEDQVWFITPRFDLDAAAAMALLATGEIGNGDEFDARLQAIDFADSFAAGKMKWPGKRPFPTPGQPWLQIGGAGEIRILGAVNWLTGWIVRGPKLTLASVVGTIGYWLLNGEPEERSFEDPISAVSEAAQIANYATMLQAARFDAHHARVTVAEAFQSGKAKTPQLICGGKAVYFDLTEANLPTESTAGIGYCMAPVSCILLFDTRANMIRFSIAAFNHDYFDYDKFIELVNAGEKGGGKWGGNRVTCIAGSPQESSTPTTVTPEQFQEIVCQCVR